MSDHLKVSFPKEVREAICHEAALRQLRPQVLVKAAMRGMLDGGLLDTVIEGDNRPEPPAGQQGDDQAGLTLLQSGILYLLGLHTGRDGMCRFSASALQARLAGYSYGDVQSAIAVLIAQGLVRRVSTSTRLMAQPHKLTQRGAELYRMLAGPESDGGAA